MDIACWQVMLQTDLMTYNLSYKMLLEIVNITSLFCSVDKSFVCIEVKLS